jgi:pyrophosphatase PpaX
MPDSARARPLAVLFDLDGTLIDTIDLLLASVRHAFRDRTERVPSEAEWIAGIGTPLASQLRPFAADDADLALLLEEYRAYQREHHDRMTRCYDRAVEVVSTLRERGHPLGVVTSKGDPIARRSLAHVGLLELMDVVVGADSTTRHKPDPEPVRLALDRLGGHPPSRALFVGDSPHDVAAGNAAGVATAAALWGPFTRDVLDRARPTYWLEGIEGLVGLVEQVQRGVEGRG